MLRSKRRWVLSTIDLIEEDPGPFPKLTTQVMTNIHWSLFFVHHFILLLAAIHLISSKLLKSCNRLVCVRAFVSPQMFNDRTKYDASQHMFSISGMGVTEPPLKVFSIDGESGAVYVHRPIDRETYSSFHVSEHTGAAYKLHSIRVCIGLVHQSASWYFCWRYSAILSGLKSVVVL